MIISLIKLVAGFILLIKGADYFVEGSSDLAKRLKIPSMIIGLTIVAMGTSLPECAVSITASLSGNNTLAVSNAVGSNIFNLVVVCGCAALFAPLPVSKETLQKEFPFSVFCGVLLMGLGFIGMCLGRIDGIGLLILFTIYLVAMVIQAKRKPLEVESSYVPLLLRKVIVYIIGGILAIKFGGDFVVNGATDIATSMGLSQTLIGLTIVAMGTSLPELVTSVVAAKKGETDIAVGNVVGSNIFNVLLVLGIAAAISPIEFIFENLIDIAILTFVSLMVWFMVWKKGFLGKNNGIILLITYALYMIYIVIR